MVRYHGLYLPCPVLTHGQIYVAFSRVKIKKGLKVVVSDADCKLSKTTTNVNQRTNINMIYFVTFFLYLHVLSITSFYLHFFYSY